MKYQFCSGFAGHIKNMLEQRALLGYSTDDCHSYLANFDRFCAANFPNETALTQDIAFAWCNDAKGNGGANRACIIRSFGRHLILAGEETYVLPPLFFVKKRPALPYICTDIELKSFFEATDSLASCAASPLLEYTVPVIFRLQYACGMRPQEVRRLRRVDIDLENGTVYIADGKHYRDRRLPVGGQVMEMCRKYDRIADTVLYNRTYFFQSPMGGAYTTAWLSGTFRKCWEKGGNGAKPDKCTPYSLRHRYATETLMRWLEEGKDMDAWIPYLSAYMGHMTFSATYYYVHLLPERLACIDAMSIPNIIPEVGANEEDI
jgi:integrase